MTLKPGCLAYLDNLAGPVPCKVITITGSSDIRPSTKHEVEVVVTDDHGLYKKGDTFKTFSLWVFPRDALRKGKYTWTIDNYLVIGGEEKC